MINATDNRSIPLSVRLALAYASLAYANALVTGDRELINLTKATLDSDVEDCQICLRAIELGME